MPFVNHRSQVLHLRQSKVLLSAVIGFNFWSPDRVGLVKLKEII